MITFNAETHEYFNGDQKLISVTQLMRKHGLAPNYEGVPSEILKRAAERGTLIHSEIEKAIKNDEVGFTAEYFSFIQYLAKNPAVEIKASELVAFNDIVAGTADLLLTDNGEEIIADIKTTATLHKEAVSWQLSIYAELVRASQPNFNPTRGQAFHFTKEGVLNVVEIPLKPIEEVKRLLDCERNGKPYNPVNALKKVGNAPVAELAAVEQLIKSIDEEKKAAEARAQELRAEILEAMEQSGTLCFENDNIKITYVAPTTRTSIDSARLKKEMVEVAEKYTKTSQVKASLRITLKGDKE